MAGCLIITAAVAAIRNYIWIELKLLFLPPFLSYRLKMRRIYADVGNWIGYKTQFKIKPFWSFKCYLMLFVCLVWKYCISTTSIEEQEKKNWEKKTEQSESQIIRYHDNRLHFYWLFLGLFPYWNFFSQISGTIFISTIFI